MSDCFEGKQEVFSIGVYPAVSLADARQRRDEAKKLWTRLETYQFPETDFLDANSNGMVRPFEGSIHCI
ncbi:hypothetical protein CTV95_06925 [Pectobacterium brasiliense]|nr:hypothetical protein CTV95_06925 [Pectobacterium brasiliense]PXB03144.1 DUF4102 domain-containing protein [Pectobacterium carotovorum subsp. carotovorum]